MLLGAIVLEIIGTTLTKQLLLEGFTGAYLVMPAFWLCSYYLLSKALRSLSLSFAYAAWEGAGLLGTTILACLLFNEEMHVIKLLAFGLILLGLTMLKLGSSHAGGVENG